MESHYQLSAVGVLLLLIATRMYLLARFQWVGSDTFYHFVCGRALRSARALGFVNPLFTVPEEFTYPPLVPFIVAITPPRFTGLLQVLGPLSDVATSLMAFFYVWHHSGIAVATASLLIYALMPSAFNEGYAFSPRPLANMFLLGAIILLSMSYEADSELAALGAGVLGGLILLTHRLTAQSFLACIGGFAILVPLTALFVVATAFVVAVVLTKGWYITSARGHCQFLFDLYRGGLTKLDPRGTLLDILRGNPFIVLTPLLYIVSGSTPDRAYTPFLVCIGMLLLLSFIWPWGHGFRHFGNASAPTAIVLGSQSQEDLLLAMIVITACLCALVIAGKLYRYPRAAELGRSTVATRAIRDASAFVRSKSILRIPTVLVWPLSLSYQVMFFAGIRIVSASGGTGSGLAYNLALGEKIRREGVNAVPQLEDVDYIIVMRAQMLALDESTWRCVHENYGATVYGRRVDRE